MNRRLLWTTLVALTALVAGLWYGRGLLMDGGVVGQPAGALVAIALPDTDGREQRLGQWTGKVIVANFWATWCAPCREEMPMFIRVQRDQGPKGLQFVGIAVDNVDKVRQFAEEIQLNYPALIGGYGAMELSKSLGNTLMALPFTVIVDRQGRVAHTQLGPLKEEQLLKIIGQLL